VHARCAAIQLGMRAVAFTKPRPGESLAELVADLAAEWHPTLNGDLTPYDVLPGSDAKIWWRCSKCQREWETKVYKRGKQGRGCRACSAARRAALQAKPAPRQSLAELLPGLAAEWHPTLNGELTPTDVMPGSAASAWWRCSTCQFEWVTRVCVRARKGHGCRKCGAVRRGVLRATPTPGNSFGDLYPDVSAEWHPTLNDDLKPTDVRPASRKKVWWRCEEGHAWQVTPADRRRGEQCPKCANRLRALKNSTPKVGLSLNDLHPETAAEWHPAKNAPLTAVDVNSGAKNRYWWKCRTCGHDWAATPYHRTQRGQACPKCSYSHRSRTKATPKPGESLADKDPRLAAEWHPTKNGSLTPFDVRPRGRASAWWRCRFGHEWYAQVAPRAEGVGCPQCSIIGVSQRQVRLEYELAAAGLPVEREYPPIAVSRRRPVKADIVMPSLRVVVEYDGSYYHARKVRKDREQTAALESAGWIVFRVREDPLPRLGGHEIVVSPTQSIKSLTVEVIRGLARLGYPARQIAEYLSDSRLWAEQAASDALYKYRAESLASESPDLAKEFHQEKNGSVAPDQLHPRSHAKFWWRCAECGHDWYTAVFIRAAGHGCPRCADRRGAMQRAVAPPGESFADLFPQPAKEWHPTKNGALTASHVRPASGKIVWWQCSRGHEWECRVADRRRYGRCRECRAIERRVRQCQQ
jgi:Probable Zinc-ribbon domain/Protein of unknown function (DUF559)